MKPYLRAATVVLVAAITGIASGASAQSDRERAIRALERPTELAEVQAYALGTWESLTVELRPTEDRTGAGVITPTYVTRRFTYESAETFVGEITLYADNYGDVPLLDFQFEGALTWGKAHPIAEGAWEIDYSLTETFAVTPRHENAAAMLNQVPVDGVDPFEVGVTQDILGKAFPLFNVAEGQIVSDYDLIYFRNGMLFMGAKHVDGTPFDTPENRPHQLQIPMARVWE